MRLCGGGLFPGVLLGGWRGRFGGGLPVFCCLCWVGVSAGWLCGPVCLAGWPFWLCCAGVVSVLLVVVLGLLGCGFCGGLWFLGVVWVGGFCGLFFLGWWGCCGCGVARGVVAFCGFAVVVGSFWLGVGVAPLSGARPWLALRARVAFLSFCRHRHVFGCPGHCALCHSSHRVSFCPFIVLVVTLDMIPVIAPFYYSGHCVPLLSTLAIVLNIVLVITPFVTLVGPLSFFLVAM